ncbi:alkaline phosphatase family protein [Halopiger aswanensis]|nr:LTA synthase family protein [Halopiger aswanensis]
MQKDWDNLLLLDACRYDILQSLADREIEKIVSVGGRSSEFIEEAMNGKELYDTVYISSNPHVEMTLDDGVFHDVIKTYGESWKNQRTNDHTKFHPENVYNIAKDNIESYSDKYIVVHFMQPHGPYFGEKAKHLRQELASEYNIRFTRLPDTEENGKKQYADLMYAAKDGYLSAAQIHEVYIENLKLVLEYAEKLANELNGKTVISSDHGENLGNPGGVFSPKYGHNGYSPEVRFVPWMEFEYEQRKSVTSETPVESESVDDETVREQLEHLGYL